MKRIIIAAAAAALFAGWAAGAETVTMQNIAHRGMWIGYGIPANTVESIKLAYDSGATWVETDFHVTKAGQFVCIHGPKVADPCGAEKNIADLTPGEVAKINLAAKTDSKGVFRIPLLDQVLAVVPKDCTLQAEIKGYTDDYADRFDEAVKAAGLCETNIVVSSFDYGALADFKKRYPAYRTLWLVKKFPDGRNFRDVSAKMIAKCKAAGIGTICPGAAYTYGKMTPEDADGIRAAGLELRLYGVNSQKALQQAKALKAAGFTCNYWKEAFDWAKEIGGIELLK